MKQYIYDESGNIYNKPEEYSGNNVFNSEVEIDIMKYLYLDGGLVEMQDSTLSDIGSYINSVDLNIILREYLANTDWYVTRFIETGIDIPQDVKDARAEARSKIV